MQKKYINHTQQGSVLIVVLIMLVVITIIGTWAIRGSITSLNIATNTQAQALLMQNSDSAFFTLENKTSDPLTFTNMRIGDGMLSYVLKPENKGKELVFCMRGENTDNFVGSRIASVIYWQGTSIKNSDFGKNGYCQIDRANDFISGRKAVMTQVTVRASRNNEDWEHMYDGDDKESSKGTGIQSVTITSTSILPNLSTGSTDAINKCLNSYTSFEDEVVKNLTVTDCLAGINVPYSTQEMEYTLRSVKAS